jgi:hypothetical protein
MAKRVICGSHLKQWGVAIQGYAGDNFGKIPELYSLGDVYVPGSKPGGYLASFMRVTKTDAEGNYDNRFSYEHFKDYMPVVGGDGGWHCPASENRLARFFARDMTKHNYDGGYGFSTNYSYWGRADLGTDSPYINAPRDLTRKQLTSRGLLMSDVMYYWGGGGGYWTYNHGTNGSSFHFKFKMNPKFRPYVSRFCDGGDGKPPSLTGSNHLYGDGHVVWRTPDSQQLEDMGKGKTRDRNYIVPMVRTNLDIDYYIRAE